MRVPKSVWVLILLSVVVLCGLGRVTGAVGTYSSDINGGVFVGPCWVELYGSPGVGCGLT